MTLKKAKLTLLLFSLAVMVSGCGDGVAGFLRSSGATSTPDEFQVLPTRPLEIPDDLAALPVPTPGATNRVQYEPEPLAIAGLTGQEQPARTANGAALLARAGAASNDPQIRATLATEDAAYRANNRGRVLERWFSNDREALIYRDMTLDAGAVYESMRARGVRVSAPPPDLVEDTN
ncbi:MAG: DUF3035 domain-containing protein [Pseudomonadota bacterium]